MSALTCAKEIIDSLARLQGEMECLSSTAAMMGAAGKSPSQETADTIARRCDRLSKAVAQALEEVDPG